MPSLQVKNRNALLGKLIAGALLVVLVLPLMSLVLVLFMNLRMQGRIESIETSLKDMAASSQPAPERVKLSDPRLRISHPATGAMLTSKLVSIEGLADTNLVVIVSRNGKIFSAMLPNAGRFASPELVLDNGENHFEVSAVDVAGKVVGFDKIVVNYRPLAVRSMAADFSRGDRRSRQIALTFDGGSNDNSAAPILDILQQQSLEATIFLTGGFVQNFPDLTRQIVAHGHEVGNHTWSHPHLTSFEMNYQQRTLPQVTRDFVHQQLTLTAALFEKVTGKPMAKLWRAPYGEHNEEIRQWAAELGYRHIGWTHGRTADESMDTMDWVADTTSAAYRSANEILHRLLRIADSDGDAANGGIVLMHLGSQRRSDEAYQMLPQLISGLRAKQYEIVTVSELLN